MKITVLAENTSACEALGSEHGLSLYIETENHKLLFDTGASGLFSTNAEKLGIDLSQVDMVVISHGHYDHGGGLKTFLKINDRAKIFIHEKAFEKHYAERPNGEIADIGLDQTLLPNTRFEFCGDNLVIDNELELFSANKGEKLLPSGNANLLMQSGETKKPDDFLHEQNLILSACGKTLLIAGCAHRGIVNIINHYAALKNSSPEHVIGGFHLYSHGSGKSEEPCIVEEIGRILLETHAKYHTCHCTGLVSYERLKSLMGEYIDYLSTGDVLTIG